MVATEVAPQPHRRGARERAPLDPLPRCARGRPARSRVAELGASSLVLVAAAAVAALVAHGTAGPPGIRVLARVALAGSAGGAALFDRAELSPGQPVSRCVALRSSGPGAAGPVEFGVTGASGGLLSQMTLQVAEGSGGGDGTCQGFSGTVLYSGPFDAMVYDGTGAAPLPTRWDPAVRAQASFEITVSVDDTPQAMGGTATADFQWVLPAAAAAAPGPAAPPVARVPGGPARGTGPGRPARHGTTLLSVAGLVALARGMARHADYLLPLLAVIVLFLLLQDRIDRADPKLTLANLASDPSVGFLPPAPPDDPPSRDGGT